MVGRRSERHRIRPIDEARVIYRRDDFTVFRRVRVVRDDDFVVAELLGEQAIQSLAQQRWLPERRDDH